MYFLKFFNIDPRRGRNECGIGKYCYAAQCTKSTGTLSDPPVTPPPKPIPPQQERIL
jgi:hypothetical protein